MEIIAFLLFVATLVSVYRAAVATRNERNLRRRVRLACLALETDLRYAHNVRQAQNELAALHDEVEQ